LIVHPDHQRKSVGSRLMQAIEARFPEAACFRLFTGERSDGNLRLYARLGYRATGSEVLSPGLTLVHLEKQP
jgi:ribosomal protein S18 acetylase RimI-like enzyme